jgi:hypothetical protein
MNIKKILINILFKTSIYLVRLSGTLMRYCFILDMGREKVEKLEKE